MTCSISGLVAIITLFVAAVLNILSFSLPLWSTSNIVNEALTKDVLKADFTAGVWGYCTDVELNQVNEDNTSATFDHCYFYRSSNNYDTSDAGATLFKNFSSVSICDGYHTAKDVGSLARKAYTLALATSAGLDSTQFDLFLGRTCSSLGWFTLTFGSLALTSGVLAVGSVLFTVTCCKNQSIFARAAKGLVGFATFCNFFTFILWAFQAHPLSVKDQVSLSSSFVLNIISALLFLGSNHLLRRHYLEQDGYRAI